jgi:hypothetical protein
VSLPLEGVDVGQEKSREGGEGDERRRESLSEARPSLDLSGK